MKTIQKLFAVVMCAALLLAMAVPARAETTGSITITNATVGKDYKAYKLFDLTYDADITLDDGIPYSVTSPVSYFFTETDDNSDLYDYLTDPEARDEDCPECPFVLTESTTEDVYMVTLAEDYNGPNDPPVPPTGAEIIEFLIFTAEDGDAPAIEAVLGDSPDAETGDDGAEASTVTFSGLDFGYYYITSSLGSVVTIDSTLKDVTVIDKNQGPHWHEFGDPDDDDDDGKVIMVLDCAEEDPDEHDHDDDCFDKIQENSAHFGDTVQFRIMVDGVAYAAPIKKETKKGADDEDDTVTYSMVDPANVSAEPKLIDYFFIKDTLDAGFSAAKDFTVKIYTTDDEDDDGITLTDDSDELTYATKTYTITEEENDDGSTTFEICIPMLNVPTDDDEKEEAADNEYYTTPYGSNPIIEITYYAVVENDAVIAGDGNLNTADFTYTTVNIDPNNPPEDPPDEPGTPNYPDDNETSTTTYVYAVGIEKVDPKGEHLEDAKFSLYVRSVVKNKTVYYGPIIGIPAEDDDGEEIPGVYNFCRVNEDDELIDDQGNLVDKDGKPTETAVSVDPVSQFETDDREFLDEDEEEPNPAYGTVTVIGLPAGTYSFKEVEAPEGYNLCNDYTNVDPELEGDYSDTVTTYYMDGKIVTKEEAEKTEKSTTEEAEEAEESTSDETEEAKKYTTSVAVYPEPIVAAVLINRQGIELPSTGGFGTNTFYIFGAMLFLSAAVVLFTRKRMAL